MKKTSIIIKVVSFWIILGVLLSPNGIWYFFQMILDLNTSYIPLSQVMLQEANICIHKGMHDYDIGIIQQIPSYLYCSQAKMSDLVAKVFRIIKRNSTLQN